jgi:hypothetical protein
MSALYDIANFPFGLSSGYMVTQNRQTRCPKVYAFSPQTEVLALCSRLIDPADLAKSCRRMGRSTCGGGRAGQARCKDFYLRVATSNARRGPLIRVGWPIYGSLITSWDVSVTRMTA